MLTKPNSLEREKYSRSNASKIIGIGPVVLELGPFEISPKCPQNWLILQRKDSSGFGPVLKKNLLVEIANFKQTVLEAQKELRAQISQAETNFAKLSGFLEILCGFSYFGLFEMSNFKETVLQDQKELHVEIALGNGKQSMNQPFVIF